jgi:hypothetical protein
MPEQSPRAMFNAMKKVVMINPKNGNGKKTKREGHKSESLLFFLCNFSVLRC